MAVSTQHCTSMLGGGGGASAAILFTSVGSMLGGGGGAAAILFTSGGSMLGAAAAAKMLATLTVGECSARRGQILPRDGGKQQHQQQHSAVTGSSSARGLQYFCEQHSD